MRLRAAPLEPHVVKIDGKDVALHEKTTTYTVRVDDRAPVVIPVSHEREQYEVASGLDDDTPHRISITRDAEAFAGVHELLGLDLSPGGRFLPLPERALRLEIVGDSIACGYGVLGADASCPFTFATERASLAYPALVGRALDADVTTLCWSGRGVLRNYDGSTKETMPELFERTLPVPPGTPWSFRAPPPSAVIVALGTNDFLGGKGVPLDLPAFEAAYVRFLVRVRELYPVAWLFVATSPMIAPGPLRDLARASLDRVVARRTADGDTHVTLLDLDHQGARVGCDSHPNAEMHRLLARQVEVAVRAKLGP
jgi:lysophospholipase L1-like esterase